MPFSGRTILCLATQAWDAHWTPVQQVMARLAPQNRVLYVEPFRPLVRRLIRPPKRTENHRRFSATPQFREALPNLFVYRLEYPYFPFHLKSGLMAALNAPLYKAELRSLLRRRGAERPWLWSFFAQSLSVLDLEFECLIYDCVDDWPAFFADAREKRFVAHVDQVLCRRADLVFVGSEPLKEKKGPLNDKTFVVNHAIDVNHFVTATDPRTRVPADLEKIPRPRIGFVGMVDQIRFDFDLMSRVAGNADYQVVIVGGFMGSAERALPKLPNLHVLGMKALEELPGYLKGLDVCLMPYQLNEATRSIYPLKLHEYMATGKPIVATAIPAVNAFGDLVYVAADYDEFVQKVGLALKESNPELARRRQECARQHSWESHVQQKISLIATHLLSASVPA